MIAIMKGKTKCREKEDIIERKKYLPVDSTGSIIGSPDKAEKSPIIKKTVIPNSQGSRKLYELTNSGIDYAKKVQSIREVEER